MLGHHGGNLDAARRLFPHAPEPWIDLSTGISPFPYPVGDLPSEVWARLPEPAAVAELERVAALAYGARPETCLVAAPGTQSLIQWLPRLLPRRRVGVLGPTYGEYARAWSAAGAEVRIVDRLEALSGFDAVVVCNPNNPDGRLLSRRGLFELASDFRMRSGSGSALLPLREKESASRDDTAVLIIDEAFVDFSPEHSLVPDLPDANVIVLRSFGKTYGLAGVRLGFAIASDEIAGHLRTALGPWAVSGPAIAIATRALGDAAWRGTTADRLRASARRLDGLLARCGATILGGTPLFRLAHDAEANSLFDHLGGLGILVRPFDFASTWLRFGIPADNAWARLQEALDHWAHRPR